MDHQDRPQWYEPFVRGVARNRTMDVARALALGLPVNGYLYSGTTPLAYAVGGRAGEAVVSLLVDAGADVNGRGPDGAGSVPLMVAVAQHRVDLVRLLLSLGADPATEEAGTPVLTVAASRGRTAANVAMMRALMGAGARPDAATLYRAAGRGGPAAVRLLIDVGIDPNATTEHGTALHAAAYQGRTDIVRTLLAAGGDPSVRMPPDSHPFPGQTPLDVARASGKRGIVSLLEAASNPDEKL